VLTGAVEAQAPRGRPLPPPRRVIEAERLIETARLSQGQLMHQDMSEFGPDWSGNGQLWWYSTGLGGTLHLAPSVPVAGRYEIYVAFTKAPDYGQVRIQVDDAKPRTVDLYAGTIRPERVLVATAALSIGTHRLLFEIVGKNRLSTAHYVGIDRIELVPVKAVSPSSL
jgi:hypothetical protein